MDNAERKTYSLEVPQIHCDGCVNLIKMSLEDKFSQVAVVKEAKRATFVTELDQPELQKQLDEVFTELKPLGYHYINLEESAGHDRA